MDLDEALRLCGWLVATYPSNYRGLTDDELRVRVENLRYAFDGFTAEDVKRAYRPFLLSRKTEPAIAEVLQVLRASAPTMKRSVVDYAERLRAASGYSELERQYGKKQTRRTAAICTTGTIEELKARLASGDD